MRQQQSTGIINILAAVLVVFCCSTGAAAAQSHDAVSKPRKKVVVEEIFWYGCPHCYAFQPYLRKWLAAKPDNVKFRLIPGVLNSKWIPHAKAFFVAQELGLVDRVHEKLFDAIHKSKRKITDQDSLRAFFVEQGVNAEDFNRIYNSPETSRLVKQVYETERDYKISSIPTIIINGKYRISARNAGNYNNMLKVMDKIVDKESN